MLMVTSINRVIPPEIFSAGILAQKFSCFMNDVHHVRLFRDWCAAAIFRRARKKCVHAGKYSG